MALSVECWQMTSVLKSIVLIFWSCSWQRPTHLSDHDLGYIGKNMHDTRIHISSKAQVCWAITHHIRTHQPRFFQIMIKPLTMKAWMKVVVRWKLDIYYSDSSKICLSSPVFSSHICSAGNPHLSDSSSKINKLAPVLSRLCKHYPESYIHPLILSIFRQYEKVSFCQFQEIKTNNVPPLNTGLTDWHIIHNNKR